MQSLELGPATAVEGAVDGGSLAGNQLSFEVSHDGTCGPVASWNTCRASTAICDAVEVCDGTNFPAQKTSPRWQGVVMRVSMTLVPQTLGLQTEKTLTEANECPICFRSAVVAARFDPKLTTRFEVINFVGTAAT